MDSTPIRELKANLDRWSAVGMPYRRFELLLHDLCLDPWEKNPVFEISVWVCLIFSAALSVEIKIGLGRNCKGIIHTWVWVHVFSCFLLPTELRASWINIFNWKVPEKILSMQGSKFISWNFNCWRQSVFKCCCVLQQGMFSEQILGDSAHWDNYYDGAFYGGSCQLELEQPWS